MNYRHVYHAGSFTDVLKHVTLIALINSLKRKGTPLCCLDTHAGIGYYDLTDTSANKTGEFRGGIEKIIGADNPPPLIEHYLQLVHGFNNQRLHAQYAALRYYPGSPMVARQLLGPNDRLIACELHPDDYQLLRQTFSGDKQVSVHHTDGYLGLKAFLPPKERRGLILIDPPYENPDEFLHLATTLPTAIKRFETGVYAIWYPIKETKTVESFYERLKNKINAEILTIELTIYPDLPQHLNGCGMAVINPPWQFAEAMEAVLPWLWKSLTINGQGHFSLRTLK